MRRLSTCVMGTLVLCITQLSLAASPKETLTIENEALRVAATPDASITVQDKRSGQIFVRNMRTRGVAGLSVREHRGMLEVGGRTGVVIRLELRQDSPFLRVTPVWHSESEVTSVIPAVFDLDLGKSTDRLRTLGTSGLKPPSEQPGSYMFMAVADPATGSGVVGGWLTHDRGSGAVLAEVNRGTVRLEARSDYGRWTMKAEEKGETFLVGFFDDARLGLEAYAAEVARHYNITLPPRPVTGYCTWYSKPHGGASDQEHIAELAAFAARELKPWGFDVVQIDDMWQQGTRRNGPAKNFLTHQPDGPYPDGMAAAAESITRQGLTAGLWIMPLAGDHLQEPFTDHPDWPLKSKDGTPYETIWGGTSLDPTHPEVLERLDEMSRTAHEWGYRYIKMDGLYTGLAVTQQYVNLAYRADDIGLAERHDPSQHVVEAYRAAMGRIRKNAPNTFLLGCSMAQNMRSFGASIGLVDAMRVGPDNGPDFAEIQRRKTEEGEEAGAAYEQSGADWPAPERIHEGYMGTPLAAPYAGSLFYFLNGRVWWVDPDPVYVRTDLETSYARLLCSWTAIAGQMCVSSEWLPGLPTDRINILRRTMPPHGKVARPVDLFEQPIPRVWTVHDPDRPEFRIVALFNWNDRPTRIATPWQRLGLDPGTRYHLFDYWENTYLPAPTGATLSMPVLARSCRILAVHEASEDRPVLLSTSRHATQGLLETRDVAWDEKAGVLRGTSTLVAGDPLELRFLLPGASPQAVFSTGRETAFKGRREEINGDAVLYRALLTSPRSGDVSWSLAPGRSRNVQ